MIFNDLRIEKDNIYKLNINIISKLYYFTYIK